MQKMREKRKKNRGHKAMKVGEVEGKSYNLVIADGRKQQWKGDAHSRVGQ
jgi:hypothetical protein